MDGVGEDKKIYIKNITINSHYNSDCVSNPIIMFLSQFNCEACNKKRHNVASLSPSGSFPQMILDMKWFGGKKEGKKSIFSRWWWPSTEKRKGNLWNSITQRPGFFFFIAISSAGPSAAWQLIPTIAPTLILSLSTDLPRVWTLTQFSSKSDCIVADNAIEVMWVFRYSCHGKRKRNLICANCTKATKPFYLHMLRMPLYCKSSVNIS